MKAATKRILCYILLCLFVLTTITASLTFGRYTSEKASDNDYKGDIEYILGDAIIINTIDDFFQAIENGYSNIQLGEELDNPLIISGGMSGVVSDLIIDLNGHEIQRNNREPILDVKDGINLTIIDTSADKTGSLYNPVGSVLKVSGGTLTAAAGIFESGPRSGKRDASGARNPGSGLYDEYASVVGTTWSSPNGGSFTATNSAVLYEKNGAAYSPAGERQLPVIQPKTVAGANNNTVNGNMYFDEGAAAYIGDIICDDTYLYFTFEADNMEFSTVANNGSADYYYEYYVKGEQDGLVDFEYVGAARQNETDVLVTVYVYNNVKRSATEQSSYAAINMASGNLYARAGYYYSYFGKEDTYCVDATGGYMAVTQGQFNVFGNGVGIQCAYTDGDNNEYLNISRGNFYSQDGDTIRVKGGMLEVGTAKIEKDATDSADNWFANGSAIAVYGGDITVNNSLKISVKGSGCAGIRSDGEGAVTANKNCTITLKGDKNVGIYSGKPSDGTSQPVIIGSSNSGAVTANITLAEGSSNSYGIFSAGGNVYIAGGGGSATFELSGTELQGIYSTGGNVNIANGTAGGVVTFTINSENTYTPNPDDPTASAAPYSRAIYSNGGNINIGTIGKTTATFNLDGSYLQGIHANGGEVNICTADVADTSAIFTLGDQAEKGATNITGIATGTAGGAAATVNIGSNSSTFTLNAYGKTMSGIFAQGGAVNLLGEATFVLDGSGMGGIYSVGGAVVLGAQSGAKPAKFTLTGSSMRGISVSGEASSATFNGETTVNMSDGINDSYGIAASQGTLTFNNSVNITAEGTSTAAYGIHATGADSVVDIGGETTILYNGAATYSDGIYNSGGNVAISSNTTIEFKNTQSNCNGIHSVSGDIDFGIASQSAANQNVVVTINLDSAYNSNGLYIENGTIDIGGLTYSSEINSQYTNSLSNTAIYAKAGTVNFATTGTAEGQGVNIVSDNLGIVSGANLNFESGNVDITTPNGTAIYVYGGNIEADSGVNVNVISKIVGASWNISGLKAPDSIYNGVFVNGGSLIASGTFNVNHTGTDNASYSGTDYAFLQQQITSYAVRVQGTTSTFVTINAGKITNSIGGGVYVSGGTVTLGSQASNVGPTVTTTGQSVFFAQAVVNDSWDYSQSQTGGHAVEVSGGNLTVNGGSYTAAHGNGILVRNTGDSQNEVTINNGTFIGNTVTTSGSGTVGPGVSYGLNIMGKNLTVTINGGNFGEKDNTDRVNSAASFYGIPVTDAARPQVEIHGGTFEGYDADVISVFRFVDVTFDGAVSVSNKAGNRAALSVQDDLLYTTDMERGSEIKISAGTFEGTAYGVWYSCGMDIFTLEGSAEIKGGPTGLQVADSIVGVAANSINISGGTVTGTTNGIYYDYRGGSVNINISGGTIGESTSTQYGIYINKALTVENALKISDKAAISGSTAAVRFHAALNAVHAAVISGGTFEGGEYGIYYGVDGEKANDGLLIEDGTFTGTGAGSYGFFFADNPWSTGPYNNVAIIGGTFSGGSRAIGTADTDDCRDIRVSDVFVEHTGQMRFGYNEKYDVNWRNNDPYKTPINTGDYVFNDYYGAPRTDFTLRIYDPNNPNIS